MSHSTDTVQGLGSLTAFRALTGEEDTNCRVAVFAGRAARGSWLPDLDLGKRVKPTVFSVLLNGERPCSSENVLNICLREF